MLQLLWKHSTDRTDPMKSKTELTEIVLQLCNCVLLKEENPQHSEMSAKEWDTLFTFASSQGVLSVITSLFADLEMPPSEARLMIASWYVSSMETAVGYQQRIDSMRQMAGMFAEAGMDIMFLKGAAIAQLYPVPGWRTFSDIDYYLYGESEKGIEVMKKHGIENSAYYHHHTQASLNDILIENHYDFVERVNHKCDIVLDDALKDLAEKEGHSQKAEFLGEDVKNAYLMTPTMNAIFLMRHMSAHFVSETIPLKMLYDWALFLKHHAKDVDWNKVSALYDQSGMTAFAGIIQELLRKRLDVSFSDCPVFPVKEEYVERVWESVIDPPEPDPHAKFTLRYYLFEAKTFFANRWKHKLVYPGESYILLFFKYAWLGVKKMLGILK